MDSRRRSVMQPVDPLVNARSGIPVPSTLKKPAPPTNMRLSLAGGPAIRHTNLAVPGSNLRHSVMRSQNTNPLLMSTSKPNMGRTPMNNSVRRGSIWGGGATAAAPSGSQLSVKDNRPLRDKSYQSRMHQEIFNYLSDAGLEITMQQIAKPQGKDYRAIFETLVLTLDPCYPFKDDARFEHEFIPALRALRYPFTNSVDVKWLAVVTSPHTWPYLLGVLHWLVEMCRNRQQYLLSGHPTIQDPANVPDEFDDQFDHKALAFQYLEDTYTLWLDLQDDFTDSNQALEQRYEKRNERAQQELQEKTEQLRRLQEEYDKLKASSPSVPEIKAEGELFSKDLAKLQLILDRYQARRDKLKEQIAYETAELIRGDQDLERLKAQLETYNHTIKEQNLSPEEVIKMNTDRETLTRNLEDLRQKIEETNRVVHTLEVTVANRVGAVEEALDTYTGILTSLGLYPTPPEPWQNVNLALDLNSASSNPQQLLEGADIRKVIKPTLSSVSEARRLERAALESETVKVTNELDQLTTECRNLDYDIGELEKQVGYLNEQADSIADATQREAAASSQQASKIERDLAQARTAAIANGLSVKSRLQALQFSYKEQVEKVSRLKEDTEVSRHLQELREFAEADA